MVAGFDRISADATAQAGGKGASLARMANAGLPVPRGFVVCAAAFAAFLDSHGGPGTLRAIAEHVDVHDRAALDRASRSLQDLIAASPMPQDLDRLVRESYRALGDNLAVAVRSSAVAEDGDTASFAGQQETYLNVSGESDVVRRVQDCWASFFSARALFYRAQKGSLADTRLAVVVQQMVDADKSGVLFTVDPVTKDRATSVIEAVAGLGESLVSGLVTPDHYKVSRESGALRHSFIPIERAGSRILTDRELDDIRRIGLRLEQHFGGPQDVEWCIRGDELLLLQSRPITTL